MELINTGGAHCRELKYRVGSMRAHELDRVVEVGALSDGIWEFSGLIAPNSSS